MSLAISPHHSVDEYPNGFEYIEQKIEIFTDRVQGWQLGVATHLVDSQTPYRAFALLHIVMSYFEMIAKYSCDPMKLKNGEMVQKTNCDLFREEVRAVFPDIPPEEQQIIERLWHGVRNGLYHTGVTGTGVILSFDWPKPIGWNDQNQILAINPDRLVQFLVADFAGFSLQLQDPKNTVLRKRFEARFDKDNQA